MKTIFFTGGGTLGPVTPLLAVYQELVGAQHIMPLRTVWIGTAHGPEREKLKLFPEIIFETLPEAKFPRFASWKLIVAPLVWMLAAMRSALLMMKYRPSIIVGAGGFTQVPLMWVGKQFGASCVIHQLDVAPTLSNVLCSWVAKRITVNFDVTARHFPTDKTIVVGNPVFIPTQPPPQPLLRKEGRIGDLSSPYEGEELGGVFLKSVKPLLVVIGGGTGAGQLNQLTMMTADELTKVFNIVLISGRRSDRRDVLQYAPTEGLYVTPFVQDTYHLLERADVVVTRAGMATLTELASLGKPTVIVPIPHSHQEANAKYFEEKEAAEVFWCDYDEVEKRAAEFAGTIKEIWADEIRKDELAKNIRKLYNSDATKLIVEEIKKFI